MSESDARSAPAGWVIGVLLAPAGQPMQRHYFGVGHGDRAKAEWTAIDQAVREGEVASGPVDGTDAGGGVKVSDPSDRFEREALTLASYGQGGASERQREQKARRGLERSCPDCQQPSNAMGDKVLEVHHLSIESEFLAAR